MVHNQLQAKDDCWRIDALYKLQPNKVHSKKMQYMKVHHGEVHHKEVHHEEVQLKLQRHKSDRWEKTTVGILRHCTSWHPCSTIRCSTQRHSTRRCCRGRCSTRRCSTSCSDTKDSKSCMRSRSNGRCSPLILQEGLLPPPHHFPPPPIPQFCLHLTPTL